MPARPRYYPAALDLRNRRVVVIGGGPIATRKITELLPTGAHITVISPTAAPRLARWVREGKLRLLRRRYRSGDLRGACLAIAATSMPTEHVKIANEARRTGAWLNVADVPALCDFIAPAVMRRGDLTITVSTAGRSPALAAWVKRMLQEVIGAEYGQVTRVLGDIRIGLRRAGRSPSVRTTLVNRLLASPLLRQLRARDHTGATRTVRRITGLSTFTIPRVARARRRKE